MARMNPIAGNLLKSILLVGTMLLGLVISRSYGGFATVDPAALEAAQAMTQEAATDAQIGGILQKAKGLIEKRDLTGAKAILTGALKSFPRDSGLRNFLGVVEAQQRNFLAAEASFEAAIEENPGYAGAYLNLGHLYQDYARRRPALRRKALETYSRLLHLDPQNAEANYQSAVLLMEEREFQRSLRSLARLPAAARPRPMVLALLFADDAGLGKIALARIDLQKLLVSPELKAADALPVLESLEKDKQPALAIELLEGIEKRDLASPATLNQLALLQEKAGHLDQARQALEKEATEEPNSAAPLVELARVANQQQDDRGALGYLAHARALQPNNAAIHFFFGMVCVEMDLHQEAYESLKKAVLLVPNNPYYNYALGAVCTQRENSREAIPYFEKYCEIKPEDPRGRLALGAAYYYSHDLKSARDELQKVTDNKITAAGADYYLGRIANDDGKWSDAMQYLGLAIRHSPGYADAYAGLGSVYLNLKNYGEAEKALLHALRIESHNYLANLNLMVLYQRTKDPRAAAQARRFAEVKNGREQRAKLFLRTIRVVP